MRTRAFIATVALTIVTAAPAQTLFIGAPAPKVEARHLVNTKIRSLDELRGRVILYEFFATWCGPSRATLPKLHQLLKSYGEKGFSVVGVTREALPQVDLWVRSNQTRIIVAVEPTGKSQQAYGFRATPSCALVGPEGKLLWTGHPNRLDNKLLERALLAVARRSSTRQRIEVVIALSKRHAAIRTAIAKGRLGDAWTALEAALAGLGRFAKERVELDEAVRRLRSALDLELKAAATAEERGRYADAIAALGLVAHHYRGRPEAVGAATRRDALIAKPEIAAEIEIGRTILKAIHLIEQNKKDEARRVLEQVVEGSNRGTREWVRATQLLKDL
ncbi:MAG: hypothetical protein CMJ18_15505 [Phycisphaeraceae bacterium]|nr:hypothetical protein [Phycisphaeraceae bacterium]